MQCSWCLFLLISSISVSEWSVEVVADDSKPAARHGSPAPPIAGDAATFARAEAEALNLVHQHMNELVPILTPLKAKNPQEYGKAITEIAAEARTLANLRSRNPARADLALDAWQKRMRVELIAAQLASMPSSEKVSQLHEAIEARVDADIRRHRFEVELADAAVVRAREHLAKVEANRDRAHEALSRLETGRDARVEARFKALQPKKAPPTAIKPVPRNPKNTVPIPVPMPTTSSRNGSSSVSAGARSLVSLSAAEPASVTLALSSGVPASPGSQRSAPGAQVEGVAR